LQSLGESPKKSSSLHCCQNMNYVLLQIRSSSLDSGGIILMEHLALRKQLTPALAPICLQGGVCPFLPLRTALEKREENEDFA